MLIIKGFWANIYNFLQNVEVSTCHFFAEGAEKSCTQQSKANTRVIVKIPP